MSDGGRLPVRSLRQTTLDVVEGDAGACGVHVIADSL